MSDRSCFDCQHYSVCAWRISHNKVSTGFLDSRNRETEALAIEKFIESYKLMASACRFFLGRDKEPEFKENWYKIAAKTYDDEVKRLIDDGMEESNARHVAFREAVLAAVKSESFLTLARQVPVLEARINELLTRP